MTVAQSEEGGVDVSLVDPLAMMGVVANTALQEVAEEARQRLERVAEALRREGSGSGTQDGVTAWRSLFFRLCRKLLQELFCRPQIRRVKAFSEPAIAGGQKLPGSRAFALLPPQLRQVDCRPQFPAARLLSLRQC